MNEIQRVQQVLSGNTSAFAYFVDTYQDMAITIANRICGNMQDAEDVVQESYVKAFRNLHSFRSDSKFSTWLYRIVYNTAITHAKTQMWLGSREAAVVADDAIHLADNTFELNMEAAERREMVSDVMQKMPAGEALLLTLYYLEDNPVKEIAKITGLNESNVKVKLFRARKLFKEMAVLNYGIQITGS
jgi:RNA polymerase sigma-70 factor (ECF subfamily)